MRSSPESTVVKMAEPQDNLVSVVEVAAVKRGDQKHCHGCGRLLHISALACPTCGASQEPATQPSTVAAVSTYRATQILTRDHVYCRGCGVGIHQLANTCPHCGAPQGANTTLAQGSVPEFGNIGSPWPAILSLVLGAICLLALFDESAWDRDTLIGYFSLAIPGLVLGIAAVSKRSSAHGVAIAG